MDVSKRQSFLVRGSERRRCVSRAASSLNASRKGIQTCKTLVITYSAREKERSRQSETSLCSESPPVA